MGSSSPKPQLLTIPGTGEGEDNIAINYMKDLMGTELEGMDIPKLNVGQAQQIAGMTGNEQTTQDLLGKYLGSSATDNEAYQAGMGELKKTLGGEFYDPRKSDFWKGFRDQSKEAQKEGVQDIRRRGQLGGGLFSTGVARTESKYQTGKEAERSQMLGGLYEHERDRASNAVGQALGYAGFEEQGKTNRLQLGSTIGAVPRNIQNQRNEANYIQQRLGNQATYDQALGQEQADYATQLSQIGMQTGAAQQLMPQWSVPQGGGTSPLGGILGLAGTLATAGK